MLNNRVLIFGASRGLGAAIVTELEKMPNTDVLGVSRKLSGLDLSKTESWPKIESLLQEFQPTHIFYVAGGGPYGGFHQKSFQSHQWAWSVTFESAAFVVYQALQMKEKPQVVLVGSAVCESQADPGASSYSAAKHALMGLYRSLRSESPDWDIRLFSPGYMDTELLPKNALTRQKSLWNPSLVAKEFVEWSFNPAELGTHKVLSIHP